MTEAQTARIRLLNDQFRLDYGPGQVVITAGITALPAELRLRILLEIQHFDQFDAANDPYEEHDFGIVSVSGSTAIWKIDYYDPDLRGMSEDPTDPAVCQRVMTIMLAEEY
jgi:hypothetical protein